jgi:hypothetical protein
MSRALRAPAPRRAGRASQAVAGDLIAAEPVLVSRDVASLLRKRIKRRARSAINALAEAVPRPRRREDALAPLIAACTAARERAIRPHPAEWVWMHERLKTRPEGAPAETPQAKRMPKTAALSGD